MRWHFKPYGEEQFLIEVGIELKTKLKSTVFSRRLKPARQLFATCRQFQTFNARGVVSPLVVYGKCSYTC